MDYISWREGLNKDSEYLEILSSMISDITPEHDCKLQKLLSVISNKVETPINAGNKKVIIFSAFADTAEYLYENVSKYMKKKYGLKSEKGGKM